MTVATDRFKAMQVRIPQMTAQWQTLNVTQQHIFQPTSKNSRHTLR